MKESKEEVVADQSQGGASASVGFVAKAGGTRMGEKEYQQLANAGGTRHMTDDEARLFLGMRLGFDPLRTQIVHEVADLRQMRAYERNPQYNATDWNYFRFDVCGWQYEYENGNLWFYES